MRQVWAGSNLRFGMDHYGDPYLLDYHLIVSTEKAMVLETHTRAGSIPADLCQGVEQMKLGLTYVGTLTIMEDEETDLFRFGLLQEQSVA